MTGVLVSRDPGASVARADPASPRPGAAGEPDVHRPSRSDHPLRAGPALSARAAAEYRSRAIFECGKLDPQVGDTPVLAPFPLVIDSAEWARVARLAEALAREALESERELVGRPSLCRRLGLPAAVRRGVARCGRTPGAARDDPRIARLDFHWAADEESGPPRWVVSEINADVPGGFIEAGPLARLMLELLAAQEQRLEAGPDPAEALAEAMADRVRAAAADGVVALVHATAFADDYQVMKRLGNALEARGLRIALAAPDHVVWSADGSATIRATGESISAMARFYPGEWLPELSPPLQALAELAHPARWQGFFGSRVPIANPATAVLVQSKRWPLVWDQLSTPLPTWRAMLPETRDPRRAPRELASGDWVLKPAMGRVGEGVLVPGVPSRDARAIRRSARRWPGGWVAQRKFWSVPVESPAGPLHVCLGVYVVDGKAAGMYARASARGVIDQGAMEVPVMIQSGAADPGVSP